jgi:hypothetical protein
VLWQHARFVRAFLRLTLAQTVSYGLYCFHSNNAGDQTMITALLIVLLIFFAALLFGFAYLMDRWHGCTLVAVMMVWVYTMQPSGTLFPFYN